jgi:hypothetical protein
MVDLEKLSDEVLIKRFKETSVFEEGEWDAYTREFLDRLEKKLSASEPQQCSTEPSTLIDLVDATEVLAKQLQSPFLRECYERLMKEAIEAGRASEPSEFQPETVDEIVKRILDALAKTV